MREKLAEIIESPGGALLDLRASASFQSELLERTPCRRRNSAKVALLRQEVEGAMGVAAINSPPWHRDHARACDQDGEIIQRDLTERLVQGISRSGGGRLLLKKA